MMKLNGKEAGDGHLFFKKTSIHISQGIFDVIIAIDKFATDVFTTLINAFDPSGFTFVESSSHPYISPSKLVA